MAVNIEDAGFEIRDIIAWVYGSGFPKSYDISKGIDKLMGAEREVVGKAKGAGTVGKNDKGNDTFVAKNQYEDGTHDITAPSSPEAKQWQGWGTALKPSMELWTLARKPLKGTVAQNVLEYGVGGLNIDGCRVDFISEEDKGNPLRFQTNNGSGSHGIFNASKDVTSVVGEKGRWPANLIHDGSDEVVGLFPDSKSNSKAKPSNRSGGVNTNFAMSLGNTTGYVDSGSAARFFYCAKASKSDRNGGLDGFPVDRPDSSPAIGMGTFEEKGVQPQQNHHPTVKPTALMQYLCRLITPPGGTVLDPYTGSGSTGKAAMFEDFRFIGIERELEYVEIATARIEAARTREPLFLEADSQKTQGGLF